MDNKFLSLVKSRKFWTAIVGVVIVVVHHLDANFPLSDQEVTNIVYLLVAYILGTGLADAAPA
jgi:hypothetical protein